MEQQNKNFKTIIVKGHLPKKFPELLRQFKQALDEGWEIPNNFEDMGDCKLYSHGHFMVRLVKEGEAVETVPETSPEAVGDEISSNEGQGITEAIEHREQIAEEREQEALEMIEELSTDPELEAKLQLIEDNSKKADILKLAAEWEIEIPEKMKLPSQIQSYLRKHVKGEL